MQSLKGLFTRSRSSTPPSRSSTPPKHSRVSNILSPYEDVFKHVSKDKKTITASDLRQMFIDTNNRLNDQELDELMTTHGSGNKGYLTKEQFIKMIRGTEGGGRRTRKSRGLASSVKKFFGMTRRGRTRRSSGLMSSVKKFFGMTRRSRQ